MQQKGHYSDLRVDKPPDTEKVLDLASVESNGVSTDTGL